MKKYFNQFIQAMKVNRLIRLVVCLILFVVFAKLSESWDWMIYPSYIFGIYPLWLLFWLIIYAWIINPIRENRPNSKFAKNIIPKLDKLVDW